MVLLNIELTDPMYSHDVVTCVRDRVLKWLGFLLLVFFFQIIGDTERARATLQAAIEKDRVRLESSIHNQTLAKCVPK